MHPEPRFGVFCVVSYHFFRLPYWDAFARGLEDGRLEIDDNLVGSAMRPVKFVAKNWLFFG